MAKRKRHVFPTDEIPHLWAHKTQSDARNATGSLYFEGETIYSYGSHFPIARHVTGKRGKTAVLFTTRTYSVTTSGHVSAVRSSIPDSVTIFRVLCPSDSPFTCMTHYVSTVKELANRATVRKMETTRNDDVQAAKGWIEECRAFCKFFSLKVPKFAKLPKIDAEKLAKQQQAIEDRRKRALEAYRKQEQALAETRAKQADEWNASGVCQHEPKHNAHVYSDVWKCESERAKEQERKDAEEWAAKSAQIIEAWKNGDAKARLRNPWDLPVFLRVAGSEVETSRGARVPLDHAKRGLEFVRAVIKRGTEYVRNGHTFHLGHYAIDRIETDGTLHAGCHHIAYAEIERIAPQLEVA